MNYSTQQPLYLSIILINFFYKKPKEKKTDAKQRRESEQKKQPNSSKIKNEAKVLRIS